MNNTVERLIKLSDNAFNSSERVSALTRWAKQTQYLLPTQSGVFYGEEAKGGSKTENLYDAAGVIANRDLAANFSATVTNPLTTWSQLSFLDEELRHDDESVAWLDKSNKILHKYLDDSNFYDQMSNAYPLFTCLGNLVLFQESDERLGVWGGYRFSSWHISEIAIAEDENKHVDTIYRKFKWSAREAFQRWGNKVSDDIKSILDIDPEKEFEFLFVIKPRDPKEVKLNSLGKALPNNRPFASYYIDPKNRLLLEEGGFYELPIYVARWSKTAGEKYGRGAGDVALPDVVTLNKFVKMSLYASELSINPPVITDRRNVSGNFRLLPRTVNVVHNIDRVKAFNLDSRFDVSENMMQRLYQKIEKAFYLDKLMLPPRTETGEMTAYEVAQRTEQMQRVLGSVLTRLNDELLRPLITRSFKMLLRNGELPQPPEMVKERGINVEVVFVSQLARSQNIEEVTATQAWLQDLALMAQVNPSVLDVVNFDNIARSTGRIRGVPETSMNSDKEISKVRAQRQQQQQQQQLLDTLQQGSDINKNFSQADQMNRSK